MYKSMPTIIILFVELQFTFGFKRWTKLVSVTSFCNRIVFLLPRFLQCNVTEECKYTCIIGYSSGELDCFSLPEPNGRMNFARRLLLAWFTSSTTYQPVGFVVDFSFFLFFSMIWNILILVVHFELTSFISLSPTIREAQWGFYIGMYEKPSEFYDWSIYKKKLHNYSDLFIWLHWKSGGFRFKMRMEDGSIYKDLELYIKKQKVWGANLYRWCPH